MKTITITVEGGVIQDIEGIPNDVLIEVWDFDTDGVEDSRVTTNDIGEAYVLSVYEGEKVR